MPNITYKAADGAQQTVQVPAGESVMEGALAHNIEGIEAECGGCLSCATCHVYVQPPWVDKLPAPEPMEDAMLDCVACERTAASRLSCQIEVTDEMEGLLVILPESQL